MKEFKTKNGDVFFVTEDINKVNVDDYYMGSVVYGQEQMFNNAFYVVDKGGYPIDDEKLLESVKRMNIVL